MNKKEKIIPIDLSHLKTIIEVEIKRYGNDVDLNHIDVSNMTSLCYLFKNSSFNGDISKWDTSRVTNMSHMFSGSDFNGDISKWNVSKVEDMSLMFLKSFFNQNISNWNVENVQTMYAMFENSEFSQDLTKWKPYQANIEDMFVECYIDTVPYWINYDDIEEREKAINSYYLQNKLNENLIDNTKTPSKNKI